jgi:glycosyltransferase involved in cell wall biosynthesis
LIRDTGESGAAHRRLISIVTPSFRQLDWLRLACASVADQTGIEVEHIVQDAGTAGIEELFAQAIPSASDTRHAVYLFVEKDAGMYDAVNRGLAKAQGEICGYLNCDEQYLPGALKRIAVFFDANPKIEIVFGDVLVVDQNGKALSYRRAIHPSPNHIRVSHLSTFSCATFFRRRLFEQGHRLNPKWKSIGDAIWIHDMLRAGVRAAIYPQLLSVFTLTGTNLSTSDPVSKKEKEVWLAETGNPLPGARTWHITLHRAHKFLAGAYRKRTLDYKIHTLKSPSTRVGFIAHNIGGVWRQ